MIRNAFLLLGCVFVTSLAAEQPSTDQPQGLRNNRPQWYALTGGDVTVSPGDVKEKTLIVVRDGSIVQIGGEAPAGAKVIDCSGKMIYPGFIDAYSEVEVNDHERKRGVVYWNSQISPQLQVSPPPVSPENNDYRKQGFVARLIAPKTGIIRGQSSVITTGDNDVVKSNVAQHAFLSLKRSSRKQYPNSPMGAVALARQAFYDARWQQQAERAFQADSTLPRPEHNDSLAALQKSLHGQLTIFEAPNELYLLRADRFAREFSITAAIRGSGREYQRLAAVKQTGRAIIVPLNFAKAPNVATSYTADEATLQQLMHWDTAPENPGRLAAAGVPIALTSYGLEKRSEFLPAVRHAVKRGLKRIDALRAITTTPAELLGVGDRLGSIATGKAASFVIVEGDLFDDGNIVETWVEGQRFEAKQQPLVNVEGEWNVQTTGKHGFILQIKAGDKLSGELSTSGKKGKTLPLKNLALIGVRLTTSFESKAIEMSGVTRLALQFDSTADEFHGEFVWPDGSRSKATARRSDADEAKDEVPKESKTKYEMASYAVNHPLGAFGRETAPDQPELLLFTNATIWTCGKQGVLKKGSILVEKGKIAKVAQEIDPPQGAVVIDLKGRHISPGIIDCHSHMATDGGVNESAQAITAEVRIGDFIDSDDITIYRQLAGGVTTANILHGSANPIGGQNQVIKLRWGALPEDMKFAGAPAGIKFALGENVKQSNWGDEYTSRYPQTRMGVVQIMEDALQAAKEYRQAQHRYKKTSKGLPVRTDLELEAIAEIVEHQRWIHCHSYRQDEILALIKTLDRHDITIGTFQHILEGYKVADAMAKHGAMGSAFSDWWAYKFEVYDAIPYNGAIMHKAGVVVSFNSDDDELGRRLNVEAAKAVKYGGVSPEEALKFVTLNPARQLRIDRYVGSIEVGKHADLAIWSQSPLSTFARCEQTWIDGRRYFDRTTDLQNRQQLQERRNTLIQKVLASGRPMLKPGERQSTISSLWPRHDEFCHHGDHDH